MTMIYRDKRGWYHAVIPSLGCDSWTVGYRKPGKLTYHSVRALPWYKTRAEAEQELGRYAARKGMERVPDDLEEPW